MWCSPCPTRVLGTVTLICLSTGRTVKGLMWPVFRTQVVWSIEVGRTARAFQFGSVDQDGVNLRVVMPGWAQWTPHRPVLPAVDVKVGIVSAAVLGLVPFMPYV